jgi:hypothetical protein
MEVVEIISRKHKERTEWTVSGKRMRALKYIPSLSSKITTASA